MRSREAAGDEVEVGAAQAEHQQRRGGDVGDGVGERDLGRDRLAGELGRDLLGRDHDDPLEPLRRVEAGRQRRPLRAGPADHEAAVDRRGDVVGVALQLGRPHQHLLLASAPARRGGRRRRGRRRSPRRWSRARAPAGSRCAAGRRSRRPGAGSRRRGRRGCRARSRPRARPGRARTRPSPRPPAPGAARPPPPSRRSRGRGWPRRRGRGRVGGARSIEDGPLDRARGRCRS